MNDTRLGRGMRQREGICMRDVMQQLRGGLGDCSKVRRKYLDGLTIDQMFDGIQRRQARHR